MLSSCTGRCSRLQRLLAARARPAGSYGLLNQCKTPMGSRLLHLWLKQPLMDLTLIRKLKDEVSEMKDKKRENQKLMQDIGRGCACCAAPSPPGGGGAAAS